MNIHHSSCHNHSHVKLGFIPLLDCAPFVVAKEKGFFQAEGLDVELSKEASWSSIRDKVAFNLLDGAHMLASMPLAATLGVGTVRSAMQTSFTVSHNGNGITVSNALYERMQRYADSPQDLHNAVALKRLLESEKNEAVRFAIVYPYSSHNYQLRDWLASAGIDPDTDMQIIVVPPTQMIDYLQQGEIQGYCVGEPWNTLAVRQGLGHMLTTGYEIWGSTPEKVLGINSQWANQNPEAHQSVIRALDQACRWVQAAENRIELFALLSEPDYLNCTPEQLSNGPDDDIIAKAAQQRFSGRRINHPSPNYALWIMSQMWRWQDLARPIRVVDVINQVYRQDLYCQALGLSVEDIPSFIKSANFDESVWLQGAIEGRVKPHPNGVIDGLILD
ncbi:nitrate transporter [Marinomonas agarivorans]|nr:nitrate transporter [Marinomonas agarivorans]